MKRFAVALLVVALACLVARVAAAADEGKKADKPKISVEDRFAKLDANKDGKVTKDEFIAGHPKMDKDKAGAMFAKIAKDKDSFTLEDFKTFMANAPKHEHKGKGAK
jgi:hypothetical protein